MSSDHHTSVPAKPAEHPAASLNRRRVRRLISHPFCRLFRFKTHPDVVLVPESGTAETVRRVEDGLKSRSIRFERVSGLLDKGNRVLTPTVVALIAGKDGVSAELGDTLKTARISGYQTVGLFPKTASHHSTRERPIPDAVVEKTDDESQNVEDLIRLIQAQIKWFAHRAILIDIVAAIAGIVGAVYATRAFYQDMAGRNEDIAEHAKERQEDVAERAKERQDDVSKLAKARQHEYLMVPYQGVVGKGPFDENRRSPAQGASLDFEFSPKEPGRHEYVLASDAVSTMLVPLDRDNLNMRSWETRASGNTTLLFITTAAPIDPETIKSVEQRVASIRRPLELEDFEVVAWNAATGFELKAGVDGGRSGGFVPGAADGVTTWANSVRETLQTIPDAWVSGLTFRVKPLASATSQPATQPDGSSGASK